MAENTKSNSLAGFRDALPRFKYHYEPLETGQIRHVNLRSDGTGELYCSIENVHLSHVQQYAALSYAWGAPEQPYTIEVRGKDGTVLGSIRQTGNLRNAIKDLWNASELTHKVFWIDQICINQEDLVERANQVLLMPQIYTKASRVITYLGPWKPADGAAIELMADIEKHYQREYESRWKGTGLDNDVLEEQKDGPMERFSNSYRHLLLNGHPGQDMFKQLPHPEIDYDHPAWPSIRDMISPDCSQRLWMVQENLLNSNVTMLRGKYILEWEMVAAIASIHTITSKVNSGTVMVANSITTFKQLWSMREVSETLSLLECMWLLQDYSCHDPNDRAFACFGIALDAADLKVIPRYDTSPKNVYRQVAIRTLEHYQTLNLFDYVVEPDLSGANPSWVPGKWGQQRETATRRFRFSINWRASGDIPGKIEVENDTLKVNGFLVDTISRTVPEFHLRQQGHYEYVMHAADARCREMLQSGESEESDLHSGYLQLVQGQIDWHVALKSRLQIMLQFLGGSEKRARFFGRSKRKVFKTATAMVYRMLCFITDGISDNEASQGYDQLIKTIESNEAQFRRLHKTIMSDQAYVSKPRAPFSLNWPKYTEKQAGLVQNLYNRPQALVCRTVFGTKGGLLGSCVNQVQEGDKLAILMGGRAVYVLRGTGDDFHLVGAAFVDGLMLGETLSFPGITKTVQEIRIT